MLLSEVQEAADAGQTSKEAPGIENGMKRLGTLERSLTLGELH